MVGSLETEDPCGQGHSLYGENNEIWSRMFVVDTRESTKTSRKVQTEAGHGVGEE